MSKSNRGDSDPVSSTRIAGKKVEELSIVEQMKARGTLELTKEQQKRKEILESYDPLIRRLNPDFLEKDIERSEENIARFEECIKKERETIAERKGIIPLLRQRDELLKKAGVFEI